MKEIQLTRGKVALVDDADFDNVNQFKWQAKRDSKSGRWYAERSDYSSGKHRTQSMHRSILGLEFGDPQEVDHIALGVESGLDNRRLNLRVTLDQNQQNVGVQKNSTSGFKAITPVKATKNNRRLSDVWRARIQVNGKRISLGYFPAPELAARAYDAAAIELHGEFAVTNSSLGLLKKPVQGVPALTVAA